jgi:hypothetical protein
MRQTTKCRYGFVDAFHPAAIWYDFDVLGIDQGISVLIAENRRSELILGNFHAQPRGDALRGVPGGKCPAARLEHKPAFVSRQPCRLTGRKQSHQACYFETTNTLCAPPGIVYGDPATSASFVGVTS